jgi:hypothetical protein
MLGLGVGAELRGPERLGKERTIGVMPWQLIGIE